MSRSSLRAVTVSLTLILSLSLAACGSSSSSSAGAGNSSSSAAAPSPGGYGAGAASSSSASATSATSTAAAASGTVSIATNPGGALKFNTDAISAKAGTVHITFTNQAAIPHNLTIVKGTNGSQVAATPTFSGSTKALTVKLAAGTYTYFCSVPGHRMAGMQGTLTVH